ncbi:FtsX-like permease family protein [Actinomadura parmotrematis]|uniref:ABC transporter permease n=1 Tax=Actinomadura parmotrematis TaxID=2864039 RepID=A0ABS7FLX6_9ACTN|nr:FtsX-like permease family protein [Actinomadura parmotrematis]MBW8481371.1 ABC transporter permease [Actinomadura parmotrematis]
MWLIARRSFAEGWARLLATMAAAALAVGLIAGSLQFTLRAQDAVSGGNASEYAAADVLVQGGTVDPDELYAPPDGRVRLDAVAGRPGVRAAAGDAMVPVTAVSRGKTITPPVGGSTYLRPWIGTPLGAYTIVAGRAPAADGEVAVVRHMADRPGADLTLLLPQAARKVRVVGIVTVQGRAAVAAGDLVLAPPETVRAAAGLPPGTWQSVWVKGSAPGLTVPDATVRRAADVRRKQRDEASATGASLGGALSAIASMAVFTGLFVIANTFGTLVRQRTRRLALLAALGTTPRQLKRLIRGEVLLLGLLAGVAGTALGYPIAALLTRLFADDGFDVSAGRIPAGWITLLVPAAAGVVVTQLAAWRSVRRAARVTPMQALRDAADDPVGRRWPRLLGALLVLALAGGLGSISFAVQAEEPPGIERTVGSAIMVMMGGVVAVAGLAVLAPFFAGPLGGLVGRLAHAAGGEPGRLARAAVRRSPRRVSAAASSLMLGVATATATALVMLSVHQRFAEAGLQVMHADHAVTAAGAGNGATSGSGAPLPLELVDRMRAVPGVTGAAALTATDVKLADPPPRRTDPDEPPEPVHLLVTGGAPAGYLRLGGHVPALRPGEVAVSSAVRDGSRLRAGQRITVRGAAGRTALTVAAFYHDPSHLFADQAIVSPATMARLDPAAPAQVILVRGGDRAALDRAAAGVPGARVLDRAAYVRAAADGVAKGLKVVYGFLAMALVLSLFGMATTVSLGVAERTREFGLLGAVGATARQIRAVVRWEAATVVLLGTLLGCGAAYGTVLAIHLATGSSFLRPGGPWWLLPLVALAAAAVTAATSALPARRAAAVPVLDAARGE